MPGSVWAKAFRRPRCVDTTVRAPRLVSSLRTAHARGPPSSGSVPVPSSSMMTRVLPSLSAMIPARRLMWAEKVERVRSMDCSSPMSASTLPSTGTVVPGAAGTCMPERAMSCSTPTVLSATVLPPAFEPVMTMQEQPRPSSKSRGTSPSSRPSLFRVCHSSGWRPLRILMRPSELISGGVMCIISEKAASARMQSIRTTVR